MDQLCSSFIATFGPLHIWFMNSIGNNNPVLNKLKTN
jgi:hypothetical protein